MQEQGDCIGVIAKDQWGSPTMVAFMFMDQDRQYFISNTSSLANGLPSNRTRWCQVDETEDAKPERVEIKLPQPKAAAIYYSANGKIDQINQIWQDDLQLERKFVTKNWTMRFNMLILGMIIVDTLKVYYECMESEEIKDDFFTALAEELIDNNFDGVNARARRISLDGSSALPALAAKK